MNLHSSFRKDNVSEEEEFENLTRGESLPTNGRIPHEQNNVVTQTV